MAEPPWTDPIIEEVRRARDEYAARFGYDLQAIRRDLAEREAQGEFVTVRRAPRRPSPSPRGGS
ncbi:MAG: hypothetical protein AB1941_09350 [Gemmatimonadota bacterium]